MDIKEALELTAAHIRECAEILKNTPGCYQEHCVMILAATKTEEALKAHLKALEALEYVAKCPQAMAAIEKVREEQPV